MCRLHVLHLACHVEPRGYTSSRLLGLSHGTTWRRRMITCWGTATATCASPPAGPCVGVRSVVRPLSAGCHVHATCGLWRRPNGHAAGGLVSGRAAPACARAVPQQIYTRTNGGRRDLLLALPLQAPCQWEVGAKGGFFFGRASCRGKAVGVKLSSGLLWRRRGPSKQDPSGCCRGTALAACRCLGLVFDSNRPYWLDGSSSLGEVSLIETIQNPWL